ncbi:cytochrome P450 [Dactylosporangium sp. AC04546]|uniref:cytochrome P450 n=1 Tax=Dactylosporangium sp. AC04546 TaxID=2862460 RepID=UPI001EE109E5|nr:cytochrome P450 [Dactylosporangium sp. AC04546]WVK82736.1 cytochrome P450 [Dactylosporangium sp. AC04546]
MLFDPAANLIRAEPVVGLPVIAGDAAVGQVCCDPEAFADVTTLAGGLAAPLLDPRLRGLLRLVWPGTHAQARLLWGRRVQGARGDLAAVVGEIVGVPGSVLRRVTVRCQDGQRGGDPVVRAAAPLAVLQAEVARLVHERAAEGRRPETVLDELLFWRGAGRDSVSLNEVAWLVSALTAAVWDAAHTARAGVVGWLRVTTQAVVLGGVRIPGGTRCLLLVDAVEPREQPARPALRALRWLAPAAPEGAGATVARLLGDGSAALQQAA